MGSQRVSAPTRGLRFLLVASLCAGWALPLIGSATAQSQDQTFPSRPIKVIVPFPAGGPTDGMARIISDRLGMVLGQSIIIENRGGGAGGSVGAKVVATADPDGYTILMTPGGSLTTGPAVHKNIGYDPFKDFTPVAKLIETPQYICVNPDLPVKSLADVAAYAKANPGKLSWGSQGFGTGTHLLAELFKLETGTNFVHVPYRGTAPMLAALLANEIQIATDPSTTVLPHIQAGTVRPIAITMPARSAKLPNVPTTAEAGFSEDGGGVLARCRSAGRNSAGHCRQAQRSLPRKSERSRDARAARHARRRRQHRHATGVRRIACRGICALGRCREGSQHQGGVKT